MTKASSTPHKTKATATPDRVIAFNPAGKPALKAWLDLGMESFQFASTRLQKCVQTQTAMLACKSLEDFHKVQTDFHKTALEDYFAHVSRMMGNTAAPKTEGSAGAGLNTKRSYDDVPL
jgi:hypothetical protein